MTNFEKFKDVLDTTSFSLDNRGEIKRCSKTPCTTCVFYTPKDNGMSCGINKAKWLKAEYDDTKEKIKQAKVEFMNTLNSNILCKTYSSCAECPMYVLKGHKFDNSTCSTVVRAVISEGIKTVLENE